MFLIIPCGELTCVSQILKKHPSTNPALLLQAAILGKLKPVARKRSRGRIYGEGFYVSNLPHRTDR